MTGLWMLIALFTVPPWPSVSAQSESSPIPRSVMAEAGQTNVWGQALAPCSFNPKTGWYRDGFCRTDSRDHGVHTVCAAMTQEFLDFTRTQGNDLSTAHPPHFPGLKPGDRWCLCSSRWDEARRAGVPPQVVLEATNQVTLARGVAMEHLQNHEAPPHPPNPGRPPPNTALPGQVTEPSSDQCPVVPKQ
eukprot:TCALIF_00877-PA protein Name:"Protein of unknown function" AED:0.13 eAED:0.13 QI:0/0.66/0.75/0.75/1/1/4/56/188